MLKDDFRGREVDGPRYANKRRRGGRE